MLDFVKSLRIASVILVGVFFIAGITNELISVVVNGMNPNQTLFVWVMLAVYVVSSLVIKFTDKKESA